MDKVLVTGANGLVGRSLIRLLRNSGFYVIATDYNPNEELSISKMDVTNPVEIEEVFEYLEPGDCIIHLAALVGGKPSEKRPQQYFWVNTMGTVNVLEAMRKKEINKIVFPSSWSTYGTDIPLPITEETPQDPQNPYAVSKVLAEQVIRLYRNYGIKSVIIRPPFIYGPEQTEKILIQEIVDILMEGGAFEIWGKGTHTREYVYVDDMAKIIRACILYEPENGSEVFITSSGLPLSVNDIVEIVNNEIAPLSVQWVPSNKWVFDQKSDPSKMIEVLDIYPFEFVGIAEGIERCLEFRSLQPTET